jgi:transposase-like protein
MALGDLADRAAIRLAQGSSPSSSEALRKWVRQAEIDSGQRGGTTSEERERIKALERENFELRRANEILRKASAYFAQAELDRRPSDGGLRRRSPRGVRGRADLQRAADRPVALLRAEAREADPRRLPKRLLRERELRAEVERVWKESQSV